MVHLLCMVHAKSQGIPVCLSSPFENHCDKTYYSKKEMQVLYCEVVFSSSCLVLVSGEIGNLLICLTQMNSLVQPRIGSVCCIRLPVESGHNKTVYAQHCYQWHHATTDWRWLGPGCWHSGSCCCSFACPWEHLILLFLVKFWPDRGTELRRSNLNLCYSCGSTLPCGCFSRTVSAWHTAWHCQSRTGLSGAEANPDTSFASLPPVELAWGTLGHCVHQSL